MGRTVEVISVENNTQQNLYYKQRTSQYCSIFLLKETRGFFFFSFSCKETLKEPQPLGNVSRETPSFLLNGVKKEND